MRIPGLTNSFLFPIVDRDLNLHGAERVLHQESGDEAGNLNAEEHVEFESGSDSQHSRDTRSSSTWDALAQVFLHRIQRSNPSTMAAQFMLNSGLETLGSLDERFATVEKILQRLSKLSTSASFRLEADFIRRGLLGEFSQLLSEIESLFQDQPRKIVDEHIQANLLERIPHSGAPIISEVSNFIENLFSDFLGPTGLDLKNLTLRDRKSSEQARAQIATALQELHFMKKHVTSHDQRLRAVQRGLERNGNFIESFEPKNFPLQALRQAEKIRSQIVEKASSAVSWHAPTPPSIAFDLLSL